MLSTQQFARQIGLTPATVRKLARTGALPAVRPEDSKNWHFDPAALKRRWKPKLGHSKPASRATCCIATICTGNPRSALTQYRNLPTDLRARVDAWCAKKGIDSPGLKLKQMQAPRPAVVLDMTCEGAD